MSANGTNGANGNGNKGNELACWTTDPRWAGITRPYSYSDVLRLRGSIQIEYTLARLGAERLMGAVLSLDQMLAERRVWRGQPTHAPAPETIAPRCA